MAAIDPPIHFHNFRRFEPINAVVSSFTLSTRTRPTSQTTPVPTSILTDPKSLTEQVSRLSSQTSSSTSSQATTSTALSISSASSAATYTSSPIADSSNGLSTSTLIISIVIPLVLIAILIPLIVLLCLTCRRKRRKQNRSSHQSQAKMRSPAARQKDIMAHRPRGKYGPSIMMRRPNSFSGFDFNFSRPRTAFSRISVRSPMATTPMNASRSITLASVQEQGEPLVIPRRPALTLLSKYASHNERVSTGRWDSPCSSPAPPPYAPVRPLTLAYPYIPPRLETPQLPDTPRSLSPQLQVATPIEIQRLPGPYAPISQVLRQSQQSRRSHARSPPQRHTPSPLSEHTEAAPMSANLQAPFQPSSSPALSDVSGLSFDPSMWIAAYERDSVVNLVDPENASSMDPHQLV